ncbi:MAG: pentapeptide repeat-containing protein [bacterium]
MASFKFVAACSKSFFWSYMVARPKCSWARPASPRYFSLVSQTIWSGASLRRSDLRDANLRGANLAGADLRRAKLKGAILTNANLSGANLRGVDLSVAKCDGIRVEGADLSGARVDGTVDVDWEAADIQNTHWVRSPRFLVAPAASSPVVVTKPTRHVDKTSTGNPNVAAQVGLAAMSIPMFLAWALLWIVGLVVAVAIVVVLFYVMVAAAFVVLIAVLLFCVCVLALAASAF